MAYTHDRRVTPLFLSGLLLWVVGCCCQPETYEGLLDGLAEEVPEPTDEQIRIDLIGQSFVYEGDAASGRTWTIAEGEFLTFKVIGRTSGQGTGYCGADLHVVLEDARAVIDGNLRIQYQLVEGAWVLEKVERFPDVDFKIRDKALEATDDLATDVAAGKTCDARAEVGMCWEYGAGILLELGEGYTEGVCGQFDGTWSDDDCPTASRKGSCKLDGYRIYYYEGFKPLNDGLTIVKHCSESGGELRIGGRRGKGSKLKKIRDR